MELYNVFNMPLSNDDERRKIQEKQLLGEELTLQEKLKAGVRDHVIKEIGNYQCKPDYCYRCVPENVLELYRQKGYIFDNRRTDYIEGQNNQGIDWYLGGAMPCNEYGFIIIECPAYKNYFIPARDGGYGMTDDIYVRHMKSSPQRNPIPISMITNIFDYRTILQEQNVVEIKGRSR